MPSHIVRIIKDFHCDSPSGPTVILAGTEYSLRLSSYYITKHEDNKEYFVLAKFAAGAPLYIPSEFYKHYERTRHINYTYREMTSI